MGDRDSDDLEPLSPEDQTRNERAYSPSSERETEVFQQNRESEQSREEAGPEVNQLPGTGGPDDSGDIDVPDEDLNPRVIAERGSDPLPHRDARNGHPDGYRSGASSQENP
jgi:hypothetical protein